MLLIGVLEQLNLAHVLQRVETHAKTGLLVVKQGEQRVELYFQQGRLMYVGPIKTNTTLGDRLLQAGVISPQARQEAMLAIGATQPSETRMALILMDLGYVTYEALRAWATKEATTVVQLLLTWSTGEMYFEDGLQPPPDRLLVALSIASLLQSISPLQPAAVASRTTSVLTQERPTSGTTRWDTSDPPPPLSASQLLSEPPPNSRNAPTLSARRSLQPANDFSTASPALVPPQRVTAPLVSRPIDTSYMRPEMVLIPTDLSLLREQNPHVQLTPEQWRLFTQVDGHTSLHMACQALGLFPEQVCQIAGELITLGLVYVLLPDSGPVHELPSIPRNLTSGFSNGYRAPEYAAATAQPWVAISPITEGLPPYVPIETQSQWGNGDNRATFVPGYGWIPYAQPIPVAGSGD